MRQASLSTHLSHSSTTLPAACPTKAVRYPGPFPHFIVDPDAIRGRMIGIFASELAWLVNQIDRSGESQSRFGLGVLRRRQATHVGLSVHHDGA